MFSIFICFSCCGYQDVEKTMIRITANALHNEVKNEERWKLERSCFQSSRHVVRCVRSIFHYAFVLVYTSMFLKKIASSAFTVQFLQHFCFALSHSSPFFLFFVVLIKIVKKSFFFF